MVRERNREIWKTTFKPVPINIATIHNDILCVRLATLAWKGVPGFAGVTFQRFVLPCDTFSTGTTWPSRSSRTRVELYVV
ncbi:hypothetical protein DPMN_014183 [Dreissena polymorpha]|uniref:Uncharacterized protein n=1 Tax=Dreissena polymorpha TaxID=45954 RepID=A0A9D4NB79_DREPO|nr:hypothetical protein DPMN_014183 [Dreissena polymorpha]